MSVCLISRRRFRRLDHTRVQPKAYLVSGTQDRQRIILTGLTLLGAMNEY